MRDASRWRARAEVPQPVVKPYIADSKAARNKRIFSLWLANHTQEEIAEKEGLKRTRVEEVLTEIADLQKTSKSEQAAAEHLTDFEPPLCNIWKQQERSASAFSPAQPCNRS